MSLGSKEHEVRAAGRLVVHQCRGKHHCADCGRAGKASQTGAAHELMTHATHIQPGWRNIPI